MNTENENKAIELRLAAVEIRMSAIEAQLQNVLGAASGLKRRQSKVDKERLKAELVMNGPYDKKGLENMKTNHLKMLASGMGVKSFGVKRPDIIKAVLSVQNKKGK